MIEFLLYISVAISDRACITQQVLIESEGEIYQGQVEVAGVIRERQRRSGLSACEVINAKGQFGDRRLRASAESWAIAWKASGDVARCGATHFDVASSKEPWTMVFKPTCRIGNHVFYLEGG